MNLLELKLYRMNGQVIYQACIYEENMPAVFNAVAGILSLMRNEPQGIRFAAGCIADLNINERAANILTAHKIDIDKLRTMSKVDILKLPGCGRDTTDNILEALYRDGGMK